MLWVSCGGVIGRRARRRFNGIPTAADRSDFVLLPRPSTVVPRALSDCDSSCLMLPRPLQSSRVASMAIAWLLVWSPLGSPGHWQRSAAFEPDVKYQLDLSGLAWIGGDEFLAVHDSKNNPRSRDWPRVSVLNLSHSGYEGVVWRHMGIDFTGRGGVSSDLESVCRLPGGRGFLICESGQEIGAEARIFHVTRRRESIEIRSHVQWPEKITNVEASEVCEVAGDLVFVYAERAESEGSTWIRWAKLSVDPWHFGEFSAALYKGRGRVAREGRPIAAMEIDDEGAIYIASTNDPGDNGPFRSVIWRIGRMVNRDGPTVQLGDAQQIARLDGVKVESLTLRTSADGDRDLYFGSDDEHFGGILRRLPRPPAFMKQP